MSVTFYNRPNSVILDSMARTLFVCAWADAEEEAGRSHGGQELFDVAPETPPAAIEAALYFVGRLEQANGRGWSVEAMLWQAWEADGHGKPDGASVIPDRYRADFGHCLVMQALGHGVSWYDDHAKVSLDGRPLVVPHIEGLCVDSEASSENDDDEGEPTRTDDDLTTEDHAKFYQDGKLVLSLDPDLTTEEMWAALDAYMDRTQHWPSVWFISDHGNEHLMVRPSK